MPSIGSPDSNTASSGIGASLSLTLAGPPDSIIPFGSCLASSSAVMSYGTSSAYTERSLILLHMRWLYWEPKSSTVILSVTAHHLPGCAAAAASSFSSILENDHPAVLRISLARRSSP